MDAVVPEGLYQILFPIPCGLLLLRTLSSNCIIPYPALKEKISFSPHHLVSLMLEKGQ